MFYPSKRFSIILLYLVLHIQTISTNTLDPTGSTDTVASQTTAEQGTVAEVTGPSVSGASMFVTDKGETTIRPAVTGITDGQRSSGASSIGGIGTQSTPVAQTAPSGIPATHAPGTNTGQTDGVNANTGTGTSAPASHNTGDTATDKTNNPSGTLVQTGATIVTPVVTETSTSSSLREKKKLYKLIVGSNLTLRAEQNDPDVLANVENAMRDLFNSSLVTVTVTNISVSSSTAKSFYTTNYTALIEILLRAKQFTCNETCIDESQKQPTLNQKQLRFKDSTGATVDVGVLSDPVPIIETTTPVPTTTPPPPPTTKIGESSPGLAGRLGMGLGISFLGVLLIAEIAFFIWRSHSGKSFRSNAYANNT